MAAEAHLQRLYLVLTAALLIATGTLWYRSSWAGGHVRATGQLQVFNASTPLTDPLQLFGYINKVLGSCSVCRPGHRPQVLAWPDCRLQVNFGACNAIQTAVLAGWKYQLITGGPGLPRAAMPERCIHG